MRCRLCGTEIGDEKNCYHCVGCKATFHRTCITEYLYHHKDCPVCTRNMTLLRMQRGAPRDIVVKRSLPKEIRKPVWSRLRLESEVPLFDLETVNVTPGTALPVREIFLEVPRVERGYRRERELERVGLLERFRESKKGIVGVGMLTAAVIIAILAPHLISHDPMTFLVEDDALINHPPTWQFPLGTDVLGRDVYSQLIWGFRNAVVVSVPSAFIIGILGTVVGLVSGYYGGFVDTILQRISVTFLLFPSIPFVALVVHSWGPTKVNFALVFGVAICLWPTAARAIRAEVKSLKNRAFIEAARVSGAEPRRIVFRHILPNVQHLTFLYMTIGVAFALSLEATVNFLGLGNVHVVTWGQMLSFTFAATKRTMTWWTILPPGLAIAYMVLGAFLISEGLREAVGKSSFRF